MRKIDDSRFNSFVGNGAPEHQATKISPIEVDKELIASRKHIIHEKQEEIISLLTPRVGRPYFSEDGFIMYNIDSTVLMKYMLEAGVKIDLTVTSPPYNIGKEYEQIIDIEKYVDWCKNWILQIYTITAKTGSFWLNLGYFEVPEKGLCVPIPYLLWNLSPFYLLQEVIWRYEAGVSTRTRLSPRNEKWLYYLKDKSNYTFNLDDIRDPNVKYPNQKKNGKFRCNPLGKNPGDVWEIPKVTTGTNRSSKERTGHPAQFPLKIIERIVKVSSNVADTVFDPFSGSFSTNVASYLLGRVAIGSEIKKEYCDVGINRFLEIQKHNEEKEAIQLDLL